MNFNSPEFLLFLPVVLLLYTAVFQREHLRNVLLLVSSYAFYMSWNWKYAGLIAFSTLLDFVIGGRLGRTEAPGKRRAYMLVTLVLNLGLLGLFKYYNFFVDATRDGAALLGVDLSWTQHHLLLPVGISFYTFQTLSYTIDIYRRDLEPEPSLLKFAVFVTFFPQLVAGPIVRAADFLPQMQRTPEVTLAKVHYGLWRIFRGLFKKVVIADLLANLAVDAVFADPAAYSSVDLLFALYGYAFQIYNDFSGYSDVAIGAAAMMGFSFSENFNRPYLSQNVREFWTRWHISLSTWLRDYLYIPLGGNRGGRLRTRCNLLITMLLGGLWHGAALNFVLWGAYHGALLVFAHKTERAPRQLSLAGRLHKRVVCFHLVLFGWLLFRVTSLHNFMDYVRGMARFTGGTALSPHFYAVLALGVLLHGSGQAAIEAFGRRFQALPALVQGGVYAGLILFFSGVTLDAPSFIYFQF